MPLAAWFSVSRERGSAILALWFRWLARAGWIGPARDPGRARSNSLSNLGRAAGQNAISLWSEPSPAVTLPVLASRIPSGTTPRRRVGRAWTTLATVCLFVCVAACTSMRSPKLGRIAGLNAPPPAGDAPYLIQPGDELEIRFFHTPEQNVTLPVRPDGFISLPLVYELRVAGRTVEDVRRELTERCSQELATPEIAVIVRSFSTYLVHVGGEVNKPGVLQLSGPRTVLQAVFEAGGMLPSASPSDVFVVRREQDGSYEIDAADLQAVLQGQDARGNFVLRPYDVVFVPASPIGDVNKFVDLYIRKNIPISFTYRLGDPNN